jgi:hypothetical protein
LLPGNLKTNTADMRPTWVWLVAGATDMRNGFNGLAA